MTNFAIELNGISKSFGPVQANKDIDLAVEAGTIHGIVGENGAGKSTLMSILYASTLGGLRWANIPTSALHVVVNGHPKELLWRPAYRNGPQGGATHPRTSAALVLARIAHS